MNWKSILCFFLVVLVVFITGCSNNIDNSSINKEAETTYQNKTASSEVPGSDKSSEVSS